MSDLSVGRRAAYDRRIGALEDQVADHLAALRELEDHWEDYRRAMRDNVGRFEEAGRRVGTENASVEHDLAVLTEVGAYAEQLAGEQDEVNAEIARTLRADGELELDRLRSERSALPWD